MADALQKLFGGPARVKLLRLFLLNPRRSFTLQEVVQRSHVSAKEARDELKLLRSIAFVKKARGKNAALMLNEKFPHREDLQYLMINATDGERVRRFLGGVGSLKFIALSGVFTGNLDGGIDLLIVGDRVNPRKLRDRMKRLEAELGRELQYALLTQADFFYRMNSSDKLVRDLIDFPHRVVLDKLNIAFK